MKWIKASERLPQKVGDYFIKWAEDKNFRSMLHGTPDGFYANEADKYRDGGGRLVDIDEIDSWLDESPESPSPSLQEAAEAYAVQMTSKTPEYKVSVLDFAAGWNAREAQQTGPILTREVFDKIWGGAYIHGFDQGIKGSSNTPNRETFWKSLNL